MQNIIDLRKVVQLNVCGIKTGDYIINIGVVLEADIYGDNVRFRIIGDVKSAYFYWYNKNVVLCCITALHSAPIGLS